MSVTPPTGSLSRVATKRRRPCLEAEDSEEKRETPYYHTRCLVKWVTAYSVEDGWSESSVLSCSRLIGQFDGAIRQYTNMVVRK